MLLFVLSEVMQFMLHSSVRVFLQLAFPDLNSNTPQSWPAIVRLAILLSTSTLAASQDFLKLYADNKVNARNIEAERLKVGFRRAVDGRVELRTREGEWFQARSCPLYSLHAPVFSCFNRCDVGVHGRTAGALHRTLQVVPDANTCHRFRTCLCVSIVSRDACFDFHR